VIWVHVAGSGLLPGRSYEAGSLYWYVCIFYSSLARWCVPVFVMISGYLFLAENKSVSISKLYTHNILRIVIALCFWSVFYSFFQHQPIFPIGNSAGHLWYLLMIIALYMALPILKNLQQVHLKYWLIVWGCFLVIGYLYRLFDMQILSLEQTTFVGYIGYFIAGHLISKVKVGNRWLYLLIGFGILVTLVGRLYYMLGANQDKADVFYDYMSLNVLITSIALFKLIIDAEIVVNDKFFALLRNVSEATFGIYLVHMFFLIELYTRIIRFIHHPLVYIPFICFVVFLLGFLFTSMVRKIPFVSKYIV
jgi:surface polysaccharide O-acyltransferase-like enzyme